MAAVRGDLVWDELRRKLTMKSPADVPATKVMSGGPVQGRTVTRDDRQRSTNVWTCLFACEATQTDRMNPQLQLSLKPNFSIVANGSALAKRKLTRMTLNNKRLTNPLLLNRKFENRSSLSSGA